MRNEHISNNVKLLFCNTMICHVSLDLFPLCPVIMRFTLTKAGLAVPIDLCRDRHLTFHGRKITVVTNNFDNGCLTFNISVSLSSKPVCVVQDPWNWLILNGLLPSLMLLISPMHLLLLHATMSTQIMVYLHSEYVQESVNMIHITVQESQYHILCFIVMLWMTQ